MGLKNGILVNFLLVGLIFIIKERTKDYVGKLMQYLEREEEKRKEINCAEMTILLVHIIGK